MVAALMLIKRGGAARLCKDHHSFVK